MKGRLRVAAATPGEGRHGVSVLPVLRVQVPVPVPPGFVGRQVGQDTFNNVFHYLFVAHSHPSNVKNSCAHCGFERAGDAMIGSLQSDCKVP